MKKLIILQVISLASLSNFTQIGAVEMQSLPETRAVPVLCTTCPTGSARFCDLCVTGAVVVGSLTVQNSFTLCPGVTGPCQCIYDDSISFNTDETHYNIKNFMAATSGPTGVSPQPFQPYFNGETGYRDTITGWPMTPFGQTGITPITITAEFEVPEDLDPSVTPTVTLHWFNPNASPEGGNCTGSYVNWQLTADYFDNLATVPLSTGTPKYILSSGDQPLTYAPTPANLTQQQVDIPLTGPALVPGAYGQITATRILPTVPGHVDSTCKLYLALMVLKYRKLAQ